MTLDKHRKQTLTTKGWLLHKKRNKKKTTPSARISVSWWGTQPHRLSDMQYIVVKKISCYTLIDSQAIILTKSLDKSSIFQYLRVLFMHLHVHNAHTPH